MAIQSTVTLKVSCSGDVTCTDQPADITNTTAPSGGPVNTVLSAGNNTITVPTGSRGVMIRPPVGSTNVKILKGVGGDTGITMDPAQPFYLPFAVSPPANFVINSAGIETVGIHWT